MRWAAIVGDRAPRLDIMNFRLVLMGPDDDPDANLTPPASPIPNRASRVQYERRGSAIIRRERLANGRIRVTPVANFNARIVRDLVFDDDVDQRREFRIEAELDDRIVHFVVPASEFPQMAWVLRKLGPQAIIYPGQQQHARAAIQSLSGRVPQERIFAHLGWRRLGSDWLYLQAGGALGAAGPRADVQVQLPAALESYSMRPPAEPTERVDAVRASLRFLSLAPDRISFPLLAAVYRAPLGNVDFSLFLTGQTGTFKTTLAALCQQHFGAKMDASRLPAHFASTANALESIAFTAKDALLVVDDFVPMGGPGDASLQSVAERLFRGAGNRQGRSRMGGNGRLRPSYPPRALIVATSEEVPRGESLRARLLIMELAPDDVNRETLNECQQSGQNGTLSAGMSAFLSWIAGRYDQLQRRLEARARELRGVYQGVAHRRLSTALAHLQSGFEIWLQFALEIGAINATERAELEQRTVNALRELAAIQTMYHRASDPALRFLSLVRTALATGQGHLANRLGRPPESPELWGWTRVGRRWFPQGTRIGWVSGNEFFLDPHISYHVVQQMAGTERLPISEQTLRHRLNERELLASVDPGRQMLQVRRVLEGRLRQVLHLNIKHLTNCSE